MCTNYIMSRNWPEFIQFEFMCTRKVNLQGDPRELTKSKRLIHPEESHFMKAIGCKMLLRYVHFDIHKFEFEEYSRKNRMKTIKNEPIF